MPRTQTARKSPLAATAVMIGEVRRFGPYGILYEVIGIEDAASLRIRVIETAEETTYPAWKLMLDPAE